MTRLLNAHEPRDLALLSRKAKFVKNVQSTEAVLAAQAMIAAAELWEKDNPGTECAGLAAPQIGINLQIVIFRRKAPAAVHPGPRRRQRKAGVSQWTVIFNPKIIKTEGVYEGETVIVDGVETVKPHEEGCLSVPHTVGKVVRPKSTTFTHTDYAGRRQPEMLVVGYNSAVLNHEIGHLKGELFLTNAYDVKRIHHKREPQYAVEA